VPVSAAFFPHKKGTSLAFFTVKYFFIRIKLWPDSSGLIEKEKDGFRYEEA
jgi:hypothetical protein